MRRRLRTVGRLIRERMRTVAAEYRRGDRVCLRNCPDPGEIAEVACLIGRIRYRIDWDGHPGDHAWYDEAEIMLLPGGRGRRGSA